MEDELSRFLTKFEKGPGCWTWTAATYRGGYGHFRRKVEGKWTMYKAHRFSYETFVGPLDKTQLVCHRCDNPSCVNPSHLFVGTYKDNAHDKIEKGRQRTGRNPKHRWLSFETAESMRSDHSAGMTYNQLAEKYKTSKAQISRVITGKTWNKGGT